MYNSLFRELLTYMMEDPRNIGPCTHLLFMAKNIERIGDHATNIAEIIYFLVHGEATQRGPAEGRQDQLRPVVDARRRRHECKPLWSWSSRTRPPSSRCCATISRTKASASAEARDGEEALVQIAEHKPDLVLLDWMLPLVSGIEVCRQLRRSPETRTPADHHADRARRGGRQASAASTAAPTTTSPSRSARAS